jgi:hypothetical protein
MKKDLFLLKSLKFSFRLPYFFPSRRRGFYASDSSDKEIIEEVSNKEIGGDEDVNIEKDVKKIVEKVVEKIVRIRNDREIKKVK